MSKKSRDDFTVSVKRTVAERAAYICANPECRNPTVGPHSDPNKSLKTGEACHICAAAIGGPRYDAKQTLEERSSINNAIWLCTTCSTRIDKDDASFSVDDLLNWKQRHEDWIRDGGIVPSLPLFTLQTLSGLTLPEDPSQITGLDCKRFREHVLVCRNAADVAITSLSALIQLPEAVIRARGDQKPVGVQVAFQSNRPQMVARIQGDGSVTRKRPSLPTNTHTFEIDRLPPQKHVQLRLITSDEVFERQDLSFDKGPWAGTDEPPNVRDFIDGTFQFEYHGATLTRRFFAPLREDKERRSWSLIEVLGDYGDWKPLALSLMI